MIRIALLAAMASPIAAQSTPWRDALAAADLREDNREAAREAAIAESGIVVGPRLVRRDRIEDALDARPGRAGAVTPAIRTWRRRR